MRKIIFLCLIFVVQYSCANEMNKTWPTGNKCNKCQSINYGFMRFQIPKTSTATLAINVNGKGLILCKFTVCGSDDILVMEITDNHLSDFKQFYDTLKIKKPIQLFNLLDDNNNSTVNIVRDIIGINKADGFYKYRNNKITVFWVNNKTQTGLNTLYLITNKGNEIYTVTGSFDQQFVNVFLSELSLSY